MPPSGPPQPPREPPRRRLRAAVEQASARAAGATRPRPRAARRSSARGRPTTATTPPTRRCCWRRCSRRAAARRRRAARRPSCETGLGDRWRASRSPGPGFLNLFLADAWYVDALAARAGGRRRASAAGGAAAPQRVNVEFVSANPTGPLHLGHARNAAYGDALARLLAFVGHAVDPRVLRQRLRLPGRQLRRARSRRAPAARSCPTTATVATTSPTLALEIPDAATRPVDEVGGEAVAMMVDARAASRCTRFGVEFDVGSRERSLHEPVAARVSSVAHGFDVLARAGADATAPTARCGCARPTFGDDKDRVLERSDRRAHLLRLRHRLPAEQARARASTT